MPKPTKTIKAWALVITKEGHKNFKVGEITHNYDGRLCIFRTKYSAIEDRTWTDEKAIKVEIKILK